MNPENTVAIRGIPGRWKWLALAAGPLAAIGVYFYMPDSYVALGGEQVALHKGTRGAAAAGLWMAIWWMTEAIPVYATALLPLAIFPLVGAADIRSTAAPYGHDLIFLFMGGFILALSMERWGLHRRIAYSALRLTGTRPAAIVAGFMAITAFLSMWVTNTATTILMLPIALSILALVEPEDSAAAADGAAEPQHRLALCLLLGIAYSASIGGIGTLVGTAPNLFLASFAERELGVEISFVNWMAIGVPVAAMLLPVVWWLLTRVLFSIDDIRIRGQRGLIEKAYRDLGPMSRGELVTLVVFVLTAACWLTRPLLAEIEVWGLRPLQGLSDAGIAITGALLLFVIPVDVRSRTFAMDWETAVKLPWGLLILFGGGLSLAAAVQDNGVGQFLVSSTVGFASIPGWVLLVLVVVMIIFFTELTSNTATTATMVPILAALAPGLGLSPFMLIVPATIAASCAFMLPVATPPNAIVFGSGLIRIPEMSRTGFWLNWIAVIIISAFAYWMVLPLLGIEPGALSVPLAAGDGGP